MYESCATATKYFGKDITGKVCGISRLLLYVIRLLVYAQAVL